MLFTTVPRELRPIDAPASQVGVLLGWGLRLGDGTAALLAGVLAYVLRFGTLPVDPAYQDQIARGVLLVLLACTSSPLYRSWRGRGLSAELWLMLGVYATGFGLAVVFATALKLSGEISRLWWLYWFVGNVFLGAGLRMVARTAAGWARARGIDVRSAVVVGRGRDAQRIAGQLERHPATGIRLDGWFDVESLAHDNSGVPRLGGMGALAGYVEAQGVNQVWIALPTSAQGEIRMILESLEHSTADIRLVPDLFGLQLINHSIEQVAGLPVINLRASPLDGDARAIKALEDRLLAVVILLLIAPLLAVIAVGVKLSSKGPVLFRQPRHGLDGKVIEVWKFRSMRVHAEHAGQVTQATKRDPRVTAFGRFLRRTSLDELPQFFNVLQGTMSIVGPRPHAVAHNHYYKSLVQHYMQRHRVKPGITGWAQVNGLRGETDTVEKMAARVEFDMHYMANWSLALDLKIIALTVCKGFIGQHAY